MRPTKLFPLTLVFALLLFMAQFAAAQDVPAPPTKKAPDARPNLLAALGLSPEQIDQIKQIHAQRQPQMLQAMRRLREANRALDMAVYADVLNEEDVQARLHEFQLAQAHMAGLRFGTELAVRKVLTPEQLIRFRELRRKFAARREAAQQRGRLPGPAGRSAPPPQ